MARHRDPTPTETGLEARPAGGVALDRRTGPQPAVDFGPYDADSMDTDPTDESAAPIAGTTDFGSIRVPLPVDGEVSVEPPGAGGTHALHVALADGRLSMSALAAPKSTRLWPELVKEIEESLKEGGARVRSFTGDWGRELHATTGSATSVFVGVDGPRWMVYGVATGPTAAMVGLDEQLRRMLRGAVVVRGGSPYPVRTVLPLTLPAHLAPPEDEPIDEASPAPVEAPLPAPALPRPPVPPTGPRPSPVSPAAGPGVSSRSGAPGVPAPSPVSPPAGPGVPSRSGAPGVPAPSPVSPPAGPGVPSRSGAPPVPAPSPLSDAPAVPGPPPPGPARPPRPPDGQVPPRSGSRSSRPAHPDQAVTDRLPVTPPPAVDEARTGPVRLVPPAGTPPVPSRSVEITGWFDRPSEPVPPTEPFAQRGGPRHVAPELGAAGRPESGWPYVEGTATGTADGAGPVRPTDRDRPQVPSGRRRRSRHADEPQVEASGWPYAAPPEREPDRELAPAPVESGRRVSGRAEFERAERERVQRERVEGERAERERAQRERVERERVERERAERERAERERAERERAERERAERERAQQERAERERAEQEPGPRRRRHAAPPSELREPRHAAPPPRGTNGTRPPEAPEELLRAVGHRRVPRLPGPRQAPEQHGGRDTPPSRRPSRGGRHAAPEPGSPPGPGPDPEFGAGFRPGFDPQFDPAPDPAPDAAPDPASTDDPGPLPPPRPSGRHRRPG